MSGPNPNTERDQQTAAKARLGQTHEAIAAEYRITRARVGQIVAAANPRSPEEAQRAEIAKRYREKYAELQAIIDHPPAKVSAIGKTTVDPDTGQIIRDMSIVVAAVREQIKIELAFRSMFGIDIAARPTIPYNEAMVQFHAAMELARAKRRREVEEDEQRRRELQALAAAIPQPGDDDISEAEIVE